MNISHEHKLIWWAPERAGTKITRQILSNYDFFVFDPKIGNEVTLKERYTSHLNGIPEKYSDYKLICNVRNPYDRIFSIFLMTRYDNIAIEKNGHKLVMDDFNKWVLNVFEPQKTSVSISPDYSIDDINYDFFSKWTFELKIPDFFIKMENLREDLEKLDFIKLDPNWNSSEIDKILENNSFKTKKSLQFDQMYDFESAKRVYFFYKRVFNIIPYNPFSFTTENLSESEKISFLHDIL
jgi:hypothetical protein